MKTTQLKEFIRHPYAWPGGYPLFAICHDGGCICKTCARDNAKILIKSTRREDDPQWQIDAVTINYEDSELYCDNCNNLIESIYE